MHNKYSLITPISLNKFILISHRIPFTKSDTLHPEFFIYIYFFKQGRFYGGGEWVHTPSHPRWKYSMCAPFYIPTQDVAQIIAFVGAYHLPPPAQIFYVRPLLHYYKKTWPYMTYLGAGGRGGGWWVRERGIPPHLAFEKLITTWTLLTLVLHLHLHLIKT